MNPICSSQQQTSEMDGFWRRQFDGEATLAQLIFDIVFGIVAPILCFVFDPVVFRGNLAGPPGFAKYQIFVYLISAVEMVALGLWLMFRHSRLASRLMGGILIAGGMLCQVIGCLLTPLSVVGIFFYGLGILGFMPFATAIVYFRNGYRALRSDQSQVSNTGRLAPILIGCLIAIGPPALLSVVIHRALTSAVNAVIQGDERQLPMANRTLKWASPVAGAELERIVEVYVNESDPVRKERLRRFYLEITGEDIGPRQRLMDD